MNRLEGPDSRLLALTHTLEEGCATMNKKTAIFSLALIVLAALGTDLRADITKTIDAPTAGANE